MNAFTNPETIKCAQELLSTMKIPLNQQVLWYNHYTCNCGEIIVPQNITLLESTIHAIQVLLDAYAYVYKCRIELKLQGYTDENNMRFISTQNDIIFTIDNGKINIIRS